MINRISSKKLIAGILIFAAMITGISTIILLNNNIDIEIKFVILYDENSSTVSNCEDLFSGLISDSAIDVQKTPLSSKNDLLYEINELSKDTQALVLIGHGTSDGFVINDDIYPWIELKEVLNNSMVSKILFLSCYSSLILINSTEKFEEKVITFDNQIDYMVATYAGSIMLASDLDLEDLVEDVYDQAIDDLDNIVQHALYCIEPLWSGSTHNNMADEAIFSYIPNILLNILSNTTRTYMEIASYADIVDQVNTADIKTILTDPVRRDLWLKHNYGVRGGITVSYFFIPIFTIPAFRGTGPEAAQASYEKAIEAYKQQDYVEAGQQLSFAAHYGQDMTMPSHVYDYLNFYVNIFNPLTLVTVLVDLAKLLDDYGDLKVHNEVESWVYNEWKNNQSFVSDVVLEAFNIQVEISESDNAIYEAATNLAIWTRNQISDRMLENVFMRQSEQAKRDVVIPLLAKGIVYTANLYKKFIEDVCNPPEKPMVPNGPNLSYINVSNQYRFMSIDPEGDMVAFEIEWGDGNTEYTQYVDSGYTLYVTHRYLMNNTYNIRVRAVDWHEDQRTRSWSKWSDIKTVVIEVAPEPPPDPSKPSIGGPSVVYVGNLATYSAEAIDPEGYSLIFTFYFGDGYIWTSDLVRPGGKVYHSHIYNTIGVKTLTVKVENTRGGQNQNSISIDVIEETPNPDPLQPDPVSGPTQGVVNTIYVFSFSTSDPNGDDVRYEIDWGDGSNQLTGFFNSGENVFLSHQWSQETAYLIKVRAQDFTGLWSTWSDAHVIIIDDGPIIIP